MRINHLIIFISVTCCALSCKKEQAAIVADDLLGQWVLVESHVEEKNTHDTRTSNQKLVSFLSDSSSTIIENGSYYKVEIDSLLTNNRNEVQLEILRADSFIQSLTFVDDRNAEIKTCFPTYSIENLSYQNNTLTNQSVVNYNEALLQTSTSEWLLLVDKEQPLLLLNDIHYHIEFTGNTLTLYSEDLSSHVEPSGEHLYTTSNSRQERLVYRRN